MTTKQEGSEYRCLTPHEIGNSVALIRKMAGLKQLTVALEAGVTERTVQRIENGERGSEETLRKVAKALRMDEKAFIGPRKVLSSEEAVEQAKRQMEKLMVIDAYRLSALKDCEAMLGTHGAIIDDHAVVDEAAGQVAIFKDCLQEWNDAYPALFSHEEKLNACRSILEQVKKLEAAGYVVRYGVYTTQDDFRVVSVLLVAKVDDELCSVKQMLVPSTFADMAWATLQ